MLVMVQNICSVLILERTLKNSELMKVPVSLSVIFFIDVTKLCAWLQAQGDRRAKKVNYFSFSYPYVYCKCSSLSVPEGGQLILCTFLFLPKERLWCVSLFFITAWKVLCWRGIPKRVGNWLVVRSLSEGLFRVITCSETSSVRKIVGHGWREPWSLPSLKAESFHSLQTAFRGETFKQEPSTREPRLFP